jgi:eukaryotic-like serine/threonine-protein kinase
MASLVSGRCITPSLRLVRPLGRGGMGHVWVADHLGLNTQVVVKFISDALSADPNALARFSREAAAAALVRSPHVVHMIDHGVLPGNLPYIAMELLDGEDLSQRLVAEHVLPPRQMATILSQVAKALMRAHECGVVHRDIKPDNIFLSDGGGEAFVKVLDFGIAKVGDPNLSHTRTGSVVGTPYYMSPEQTTGSRAVDHRTDVWSLGVVAFEALTGKRPFEGGTVGGLAVKICHGPMPVPSEVAPSLPPALDGWFLRACARDVDERFATAQELAVAFGTAVGGSEAVPFVRRRDDDGGGLERASARVRAEIASAPTVPQQSPGAYSVEASGAVVTPPPATSVTSGPVAGLRPAARWPRRLVLPAVAIVAVVGFFFLASRPGTLPQPAGAGVPAAPIPSSVASSTSRTAPASELEPSSQPSAGVAPSSAPSVAGAPSGAPAARSLPTAGRAGPARATSAPPASSATPSAAPPVSTADPFGNGRK